MAKVERRREKILSEGNVLARKVGLEKMNYTSIYQKEIFEFSQDIRREVKFSRDLFKSTFEDLYSESN